MNMARPPFPRKERGGGLVLEHFAARDGPAFFVHPPLTLYPLPLTAPTPSPQRSPSPPELWIRLRLCGRLAAADF